jgi:hypothetical protein
MGPRALAGPLARRASLLALGTFALHQLRYATAYGGEASAALARQGHSYLGDLAPTLVALALSVLLARLLAARLGRVGDVQSRSRSLPRDSLALGAALLAIFSAQELTEGALAAGHPGGAAAVAAGGGLIALPLALAIGFAIACLDRFLSGAETSLARRASTHAGARQRPAAAPTPRSAPVMALATACLAFGFARRPPPALLSR